MSDTTPLRNSCLLPLRAYSPGQRRDRGAAKDMNIADHFFKKKPLNMEHPNTT